jgi:hypothetical protein
MDTQTLMPPETPIAMTKRDLLEVWSVLEKVVVSLRKIGSEYAIPMDQADQTPEQRRQMLEAFEDFFNPELFTELARARRLVVAHLPNEETEYISENIIRFWSPNGVKASQAEE